MLSHDQLLECLLNNGPALKDNAAFEAEIDQVVKLLAALLAKPDCYEDILCQVFGAMLNIYRYEFKAIPATVDIILDDMLSPVVEPLNINSAVKNCIAYVIRTNAVDFNQFAPVLRAFNTNYAYVVKKLAAFNAMILFKKDFDLKQPCFFGLSENEMIKKSISMLGPYDGFLVPIFYRGISENCQDRKTRH
jgi:hypothetical protein